MAGVVLVLYCHGACAGRVVQLYKKRCYHAREPVLPSDSSFLFALSVFCVFRDLTLQGRMRKPLVLSMLVFLIMRPLICSANFHVVNMYYGFNGAAGFDYQMVIPSTKWGCGGVQSDTIAGGRYPDCHGGYDLHVPNNTCDYSGVTIRPACSGGYFGKLRDVRGGDIGNCYWHDAGDVSAFSCNLNVSNSNYQIVYDRLLCSTKMCGS